MRKLSMMSAILMLVAAPVHADAVKSFFPKKGLGQFIVWNLDVATFPSAVGPRLSPEAHTFATMKFHDEPPAEEGWGRVADKYGLHMWFEIVKRGDFNRDGLEDVVVCESDTAEYGHLNATQPFFLTRYSATTPVVAIAREAVLRPGVCDWNPPKDQR
jgi:hypothetical protein